MFDTAVTCVKERLEKLPLGEYGVEAFALADNEQIVLEKHFVKSIYRDIYSHTKSFVALGVGIALDNGLMKLDDRLVDYFPEFVPKAHSPLLEKITLKNLLTMTSGFGAQYLARGDRWRGVGYPDYVPYMLSRPMMEEPGSRFLYSSGDSHLAGRMLAKAAGVPLTHFMYENLFSPLDIGFPIWAHEPAGEACCGSGLVLPVDAQVKLGQLCLNYGIYNGKRIVSREWIETASQIKKLTGVPDPWQYGYGYQFWISAYPGIYSARGVYGQHTYILPHQNLSLSIQSSENGNQKEIERQLAQVLLEACRL